MSVTKNIVEPALSFLSKASVAGKAGTQADGTAKPLRELVRNS